MSGQVLRVKGYYDVMIRKHHCEDVYDILLFFISIFEDHEYYDVIIAKNESEAACGP